MTIDPNDWAVRFVPFRSAKIDVMDRILTGYPIVFNSLSQDLGGFKERIAPTAVDRTLRTGTNVDAVVDHRHDTQSIIGSTDSGLMRMKKDTRGLHVSIEPPDTTTVRDLIVNVRAKLIKGMSFVFRVFPDGQTWEEEDGIIVRTITDMEFNEVSVVINPAYLDTAVSARQNAADARALAEYRSLSRFTPSRAFRERMLKATTR
jgi:HK97 family phage prohead protease